MMARRTTAYVCLARVVDANHVDSAIFVNTRVCPYFFTWILVSVWSRSISLEALVSPDSHLYNYINPLGAVGNWIEPYRFRAKAEPRQ